MQKRNKEKVNWNKYYYQLRASQLVVIELII